MDFIGKIDSTKDLVNKEYVDGLWTSDKIVSTLASKSIALGKLNGGTTAGFLKTTSAGVVSAATLSESDIPSITKSKISDFPTTWAWSSVSGRPTKLSDFTDDLGASPVHTHSRVEYSGKMPSTDGYADWGKGVRFYRNTGSDVCSAETAGHIPGYSTILSVNHSVYGFFQLIDDYAENRLYLRSFKYSSATTGTWQVTRKIANVDDLSGYLPLTGGSITGDLSIGGTLSVTGAINGKATDADHADAATNSDTIDGFHVATMPGISNTLSNNTMLAMRAQTINLSDTSVYSTSNYYPITFPVSRACGFVDVRLSYISSPYQYIDFLVRGASYYGVTNKVIVRELTRWSGNWYIGCIGAGSSTNALCCIWLKGGYSYRVISNSTFTAHSANYTNGSCTYTVGTNPYGGTNTNVTVMFTPGGSAGTEGIGPSTQSSAAYMSGSLRVNGGLYTNSNLQVQGYVRAVGEITGFYSSSDIRLKKDLTTLSLDGDKIASLPLYSYKRTDRNNKQTDGTIAQEVQKLLPNEVYDRGDGYLAMAEGQLGLIFGINAHKEIKRLSERVNKLERLIEDMDNGMERLAEMN